MGARYPRGISSPAIGGTLGTLAPSHQEPVPHIELFKIRNASVSARPFAIVEIGSQPREANVGIPRGK
ncbi:MAG: hypothetical protein ABI560_17765, partial [Myxococcales bacterium]